VDELIRILIDRLVNKGMQSTSIPAYVRDIVNTIAVTGNLAPGPLNRRLERLGWNDVHLDEYTLELVTAIFGNDTEYRSPAWFEQTLRNKGLEDPPD